MTESALLLASGASAASSAWPRAAGFGPGLCIYCRTEKFVYWPPDSRLPSAGCPGCHRQGCGR